MTAKPARLPLQLLNSGSAPARFMNSLPLLRFIPYRVRDVAAMCMAEELLDAQGQAWFEAARKKMESHFREEFHQLRRLLKDAYGPLDPDADTRVVAAFRDAGASTSLASLLEQVLNRANYEKLGREQVKRALTRSSLFPVQLYVDVDEFEEVLLYTRGASHRKEEVCKLLGLWRETVEFVNFERVVLYLRFRENIDAESTLGGCRPGATMLKLFQNVPAADLEMLFPNTRVGMRTVDKLLIGVPALLSGGVVVSTKLGATLIILGSLIGFWLGLSSEPVKLDRTAVLALLAGIGALVGYLWKQFSKFRTRKLQYTQALTENLYFKLLDNNAGVLFRILDEAEDSEFKEGLLAYYFLLAHGSPMTAAELDKTIEAWLERRWECRIDFEIGDALQKLERLGLASRSGDLWAIAGP